MRERYLLCGMERYLGGYSSPSSSPGYSSLLPHLSLTVKVKEEEQLHVPRPRGDLKTMHDFIPRFDSGKKRFSTFCSFFPELIK